MRNDFWVTKKSGGVGFNFNNWYQFLMKLRYFAKQLGVGARDIERSLFFAHQTNQKAPYISAHANV